MPRLKSQTIQRLQRLLEVLPSKRVSSFLYGVLPLSILSGVLDLGTVTVAARIAGSLIGNDLKDTIPGINIFNVSIEEQAIALVIILVILSWAASIAKTLRIICVERLSAQVWKDISNQIIQNIIGQPYDYFLKAKSSAVSSQILVNVTNITYYVIQPVLLIISSTIVIGFITTALITALGVKAIFLLILLGLAFTTLSLFIVPYLRLSSKQFVRSDILSNSMLNQIFYSIRDIHLTQTGRFFGSKFDKVVDNVKRFRWRSRVLPEIPRIVIEPLAISLIFGAALLPIPGAQGAGTDSLAKTLIPFVSTFIVGAAKLTPPLQDLFRSITTVRGTLPLLDSVLGYLELPSPRRGETFTSSLSPEGIFPRREISLHKVGYKYSEAEQATLRSISMNIPVGSRIALMGPTGSGKTTLSNILLSHLEPTTGEIRLDGIPLEASDISAWQRCCSEVPQNINLLDASIIENIAFGTPENEVKHDEVWDAISAAQLYDLITEMPHGLYTCIGDNGINLSGGQRQRLALARVFYRRTRFLILDEATSALDEKTESDVINSLEIIGRRCTTVVIAHRLNTLSKCDYIYEINDGHIVSSGTYDDLCNPSHPLGTSVRV